MPRFRASDGVQLHYLDEGAGPAIVFVHGWMMSSAVWREQFAAFRGTHRLLALDLRGCGLSESRAGTETMPRYARDLHEFLEAMDVSGAALVGWSMGGGIVTEYLSRHGAQRAGAVALVDFPPRLEEDPSVADKVCHNLFTRRDSFVQSFVRRMFLNPLPPETESWMLEAAGQCLPTVACDMYRAMRGVGKPAALPTFELPALLAFPAQGWFPGALREWKTLFPRNDAPPFPASKHCPFLEEPAAFNAALRALLGRID